MKTYFLMICLLFSAAASEAQDNIKSVNVTVYNSNLGVVKEVRSVDIKGKQEILRIRDVAEKIDPTSVNIKFNGKVLEQNYQYDLVGMQKILQKYIDKNVSLIGEKVVLSGKLLSVNKNNIVISKSSGGLVMLPNYEDYRINVGDLPNGLITKPTLLWKVEADKTGKQDTEISYMTGGMNWHAEYVAVLNKDDSEMDMNAWVSIENESGAVYKNAKLKLVAGDVNRINDRNKIQLESAQPMVARDGFSQFREKEFFEYHIYNLQRKTDLANNETKQISLFEADNIDIEKIYKYVGYNSKVNVYINFKNSSGNNLGIPMPKGKVRLYKSDDKTIEFIGEDRIDHTPKNEKIELLLGNAFDVVAEEKLVESKSLTNNVFENKYEITLKNRKSEDITVEVERTLWGDWEMLENSHDYEKKDARTVVFKVPVGEDEEAKLIYKVRIKNR